MIKNFQSWFDDNIFDNKKVDGIAYIVLYIIIPVIITGISIDVISEDNVPMVYCYTTIFISAINSIYDSMNRWKSNNKTIRNTKLFLIMLANMIVGIYCLFIILYILIANKTPLRHDGILCVYFLAIVISLVDVWACFGKEMALLDYVRKDGEKK